jgi:hypothetical protein
MLSKKYSFKLIPERGFIPTTTLHEKISEGSKVDSQTNLKIKKLQIRQISKDEREDQITQQVTQNEKQEISDSNKRNFLKVATIAGAGILASQLIPKRADALVMGSTPSSSVVGVKDATNVRVNPATEETVSSLLTGQGVTKLTTSLSSSGTVRTPSSGKKIRVYASRFSLTADATSVSFRFTAGGTDYEKYLSPKTGGLYGSNNHPNYIEGGVDEVLYCSISGTTTIQINIDYLEV